MTLQGRGTLPSGAPSRAPVQRWFSTHPGNRAPPGCHARCAGGVARPALAARARAGSPASSRRSPRPRRPLRGRRAPPRWPPARRRRRRCRPRLPRARPFLLGCGTGCATRAGACGAGRLAGRPRPHTAPGRLTPTPRGLHGCAAPGPAVAQASRGRQAAGWSCADLRPAAAAARATRQSLCCRAERRRGGARAHAGAGAVQGRAAPAPRRRLGPHAQAWSRGRAASGRSVRSPGVQPTAATRSWGRARWRRSERSAQRPPQRLQRAAAGCAPGCWGRAGPRPPARTAPRGHTSPARRAQPQSTCRPPDRYWAVRVTGSCRDRATRSRQVTDGISWVGEAPAGD